MPYTPLAGSGGRVKVSGGSALASLTGWREQQSSEVFNMTTFESTADIRGVIGEQRVGSNIAGTVVNFEGYMDSAAPYPMLSFPIGTQITLDLLFQKTGALGIRAVPIIVSAFEAGPKLREGQTFTAAGSVNGVMPEPSLS